MKIGDRVRIKWNPSKICKIIGIFNNKYKVKELSKHGTTWYKLSQEELQDQIKSRKDGPPRD